MKRQLPFILVFVFAVFMIFQYFVPHESSEWIYEFLLDWTTIIGIFALALGVWSLVTVSVTKIKERRTAWQYTIVTLVGLVTMIFLGFFAQADGKWGFHFYTSEGLQSPPFRGGYDYVINPIQSTMFSMLAFFIASAAYRAFRARNVLASLLLVAALIMMLRFFPYFGDSAGAFLSNFANWLLNVPSLAANRAIIMGIGLGMVATALKIILGIERGYMGR
jgi:hypothetical protein